MSKVYLQVTGCLDCPAAEWEWGTCGLMLDENGDARTRYNYDPPAPEWCPLRWDAHVLEWLDAET